MDLLNHSALAVALVNREDANNNLPDAFAIMPDKYKKLVISKEDCQRDVDGRAARRLVRQLIN